MDLVDLADDVVSLSIPVAADVPAITAACQDPTIASFTTVPFPYQEEHAQGFVTTMVPQSWEKSFGATWAIRIGDALAGMITLEQRESGWSEIGYWTAPQFRGQGVMTRAVGLVIEHGFKVGVQRIGWRAVVGNWGSWKAVWRHGFRIEGIQRGSMVDPTRPTAPRRDAWSGGLLATDPRAPVAPWDGPESGLPARPDGARPLDLVRQFHATYDLPIVSTGATLDVASLGMRMSLIAEEFAELVGAVYGEAAEATITTAYADAVAGDDQTRDTVEVADALADLVYVIYGMALETGIPLTQVLDEVQRSNLSKLNADGSVLRRADGKVLKGPNFEPPDIARVLAEHRLR